MIFVAYAKWDASYNYKLKYIYFIGLLIEYG